MLTGVDFVRSVCTQRKIPVSQLEQACNFSNGYLNPKKLKKIPYDRAVAIAEYLNVSLNQVLGNEPAEEADVPVVDGQALSDNELKAVETLRSLSPEQAALVYRMLGIEVE